MKRLLLLVALISFPAHASDDARITADVKYRSYRVRPQPRLTYNSAKFEFILHRDGTVDEVFMSRGRHPNNGSATSRLGNRFKVIDENTIERKIESKDRVQTIRIVVLGKGCKATMTNELKPGSTEFEGRSTQLGAPAFYRDWAMTSSVCTIR